MIYDIRYIKLARAKTLVKKIEIFSSSVSKTPLALKIYKKDYKALIDKATNQEKKAITDLKFNDIVLEQHGE